MMRDTDIKNFLRPLFIDDDIAHGLSLQFSKTFKRLASESTDQFLPTPVTNAILRPAAGNERGRYLAIDIGGTNLRVGFIELLGNRDDPALRDLQSANGKPDTYNPFPRLRRHLEKSWPILEHLKNENAESLFAWIGSCMAEVVGEGCREFDLSRTTPLPLGVTFSFPMIQHSLAEATLMKLGKGFAITSNLDLSSHLVQGYDVGKPPDLPPIKIAAIANDAVSTLVSFIYQSHESEARKAVMGLICGTGCNATLPLRVDSLGQSKLPAQLKNSVDLPRNGHMEIAVNTELSIKGSAPPIHQFGLISEWDKELDAAGEAPGFQPLEYMTAGRYLGELGRIVLVAYLTGPLGHSKEAIPQRLHDRFGLTTMFLSQVRPPGTSGLLQELRDRFPEDIESSSFRWTEETALAIYEISKAIEVRAAGIIAAATVGLLAFSGEVPLGECALSAENGQNITSNGQTKTQKELIVGYTGGCISQFQDYLADCQRFLDRILEKEFGLMAPVRIMLSPCHDGGITGAGVLCGASQVLERPQQPPELMGTQQ